MSARGWGAAAVAGLALIWLHQAKAEPDEYTRIERGRYLATVGDCAACHTDNGGPTYAGGLRLQTPFGPIAAPNITPDTDTGIGNWTEDQFITAMQTGIAPGGTHLYPAFPYAYFSKVSRDDLADIYLYLRTLPPVHHAVNRDTLPFPFDIRLLLAVWNRLFFAPGEFKPQASQSDQYNRGAYLVQGLGHCGECHTPKNMLGGDRTSAPYRGGLLQGWFAPNITGTPRIGVGDWSVDDIVEYLKTGHNAHAAASGPMAEEIVNSSSRMTDADLKAIAVYLKSSDDGAAPGQPQSLPANDPAMRAGAAIYTDTCSACHTATGAGVERMFPALAGSAAVQQRDPTTLIRVVALGAQSAATDASPTGPAMPAFTWRLDAGQIADVLTYIRNSWGNAAKAVTPDEVQNALKAAAN
jgi:mono/diheme cytochrome c family protein